MLPAGDLAKKADAEKEWLKINVRKLKNLGLTISHQPGYELSPRLRVICNFSKWATVALGILLIMLAWREATRSTEARELLWS